MGFSLKFTKTYKNPVKTIKSDIIVDNDNIYGTKHHHSNDTNKSINVLEFDGKPLTNESNCKVKILPVIIAQPNSNKLYEKLQMKTDSTCDVTMDDSPIATKVYNRDDYLAEVASLPNTSDIKDYENMPIKEFGKAILRGMGWKEGVSIGLTNKGLIEPIEYIPRTKGLGLGAQSRSEYLKNTDCNHTTKSNEKKSTYRYIGEKDQPQNKKAIEYGLIKYGDWEGNYVRIVQKVKDSNNYIVKFINQNQMETINGKNLSLVSKEEALSNILKQNDIITSDLKNWLLPNLYVRIISKSFKNGKYYRQKAHVINVYSDTRYCTLITDDSIQLKNVHESYLQTIIPNDEDSTVVVLAGEFKHKRGYVLSKEKDIANVHFPDDDSIHSLCFDYICQISVRD